MTLEKTLRPGQLADVLEVSPKTISRWINEGKIRCQRTLGGAIGRGHARIPLSEVERIKQVFQDGGRMGVVASPTGREAP